MQKEEGFPYDKNFIDMTEKYIRSLPKFPWTDVVAVLSAYSIVGRAQLSGLQGIKNDTLSHYRLLIIVMKILA